MIKKFIAATTLAAALAAAAGVHADSIITQDPAGDSNGNNIDIVSVKAGHSPGGVIKHRATFAKKVNPNDVPPNLFISVPKGGPGPEYYIGVVGNGASVFEADGTGIGKASVTPVGDNGFKYKFREKLIGSPKRYGWSLAVVGKDGELFDAAPDNGFVKHSLKR